MVGDGKGTFAELVVPHFDFEIVSATHKERLGEMKVHRSHGAGVFVKRLQQGADAVVPQLHRARVQRGQKPGPRGMKTHPLDPAALRLKLYDERTHQIPKRKEKKRKEKTKKNKKKTKVCSALV
jgi:hypothetical protein